MGMSWIILDELPGLVNGLTKTKWKDPPCFNGITMEKHNFYIGKSLHRVYITKWKDPAFFMGKLTLSMAMASIAMLT